MQEHENMCQSYEDTIEIYSYVEGAPKYNNSETVHQCMGWAGATDTITVNLFASWPMHSGDFYDLARLYSKKGFFVFDYFLV